MVSLDGSATTASGNDRGGSGAAKTAVSTAKPNAPTTVALTASGKPKEKRRNNEKRKEKSRDAARCRRSRETEIFTDLAQELPLKKEDVNQLDKASVMRLAIAYLKIRDMLHMFPKLKTITGEMSPAENSFLMAEHESDSNASSSSLNSTQSSEPEPSNIKDDDLLESIKTCQLVKQTIDGFLCILSNDGDITYVTDNITDYLGIAKIDILGQQIWEYTHQCDHVELKEALNIKRIGLADKIKDEHMPEDGLSTDHRDLYVRFKCTLTSRGRSINIKSASYKVIHMTGHLVVNRKGDRVLVAIGRPIPHPSNIEIPLESSTFLTKHSLDMKFTYVDEKMLNLIGYEPDDLLEKSLFGCHHGEDSESLMATFKAVLNKGQAETCRYRFLGKSGGYCWIVTQATLVYDKMKPQSVVCVNYVISQLENNNEIYSLAQYEASQKKLDSKNEDSNNKNSPQTACIDDKPTQQQQQQQQQEQQQAIKQEPETSIKTLCKQSNQTTIDNNTSVSTSPIPTTTPPPPPNDKPTKPATPSTTIRVPAATPSPPQTNIKREKCPTAPLYSEHGSSAITVATTCPVAPLVRDLHQTKLCSRPVALPSSSINSLKTLHIEENRPKSVTASVFRPNPQAAGNNAAPPPLLHPLAGQSEPIGSAILGNASTRAQSVTVTASVFTPISQLPANTKFNTHLVKQPQQQQLQQQDMNKGFLSFPEDATELTMLKEEPDDLVHLGQSPIVDACMPLDETNSLFSDVLACGFIGSYGANLLNDDINSLDSTASSHRTTGSPSIQNCNYNANSSNCSSTAGLMQQQQQHQHQHQQQSCNNGNNNNNNNNKGVNIDPLINYRDQSNDTSCSPQHLLSPNMTAKSPDGSSLPSLCSPDSLSHEDEFAFMSMNVNDEIDLSMRAPYIPMNEQEDLPLLTDDLMWCSSSSFSEELSMHKDSDSLHLQLASHHQSQHQSHQHQQQHHHQHNQLTHQQQQQIGDILSYSHQQQFTSNSLCSSPASTVSSMSPSPVHSQLHHHQQQQQQQHDSNAVFGDSSELAALLCGAGNGTLSILSGVSNGSGIKDDANANHSNSNTNGGVIDGGGNLVVNRKSQLGDGLSSDDFRMQLQHQQQQHTTQLLGLSINCKKEKYENSLGASSMCDPIEDPFVYGKVSNNLDCWSELLQINVNDNSAASVVSPTTDSTAAPSPQSSSAATTTSQIDDLQQQNCKTSLDLQQQQQQQNVLLNAVPLTTIQSNKNIMLQQLQQQQRSNNTTQKLLISEEILSGGNHRTHAIHNSTGSAGKVTTIKLINGGTAALTPVTTTATIRVVESKVPQQQQQQRQQNQKKNVTLMQAIAASAPQQHGNKRHSTSSSGQTQTERKRLKSGTTATTQQPQQQQHQQQPPSTTKTVELLQQLVATSSSNAKSSPTVQRKSLWPNTDASNIGKRHQQQQQQTQEQSQSHSVLKNLLISGCDNVLNIITKPEEMLIDDNSMQSPCISPYPKPTGETATAGVSVLRNSRNNPMIGGTELLPSPTFGPRDDDSNPPGLTACDTDTASDSGIDDISLGENGTPLKIAGANVSGDFEGLLLKYPQIEEAAPSLAVTFTDDCDLASSFEAAASGLPTGSSSASSGKSPLAAFMDTDDSPLLTPPLPMDLWNEPAFLTDTAFDYGLNEWAH